MLRALRATPLLPLILLLALAGCDRGPEQVPPEVARVREQSARAACASRELLRRASDDVASLEETLASTSESGPASEVTRRAGTAALGFARAYQQHAQLRTGRILQLDSAYNHSRGAADSTRHVEAARRLAARIPDPETLEANVASAYERDFAALFGDPDHPCNWDLDDE
jgi:hypothetical protein